MWGLLRKNLQIWSNVRVKSPHPQLLKVYFFRIKYSDSDVKTAKLQNKIPSLQISKMSKRTKILLLVYMIFIAEMAEDWEFEMICLMYHPFLYFLFFFFRELYKFIIVFKCEGRDETNCEMACFRFFRLALTH